VTLIGTSNTPFQCWGGPFGRDASATVMIDLSGYYAEDVCLKGNSFAG
jgi:hypothetical protein